MPESIINEHTDKNIKNYLSEDKNLSKVNKPRDLIEDLESRNKKDARRKSGKLFFASLFLIIAAVLAAAYFFYEKGQRSFDSAKVKIELEADKEIVSGAETVINIKYANNTNVGLKNAKISLDVPKEFKFISSDKETQVGPAESPVISWKLDSLPAGGSGKIKLFGKIIGSKNSEYDFDSQISYMPDNFNYEFKSADGLSRVNLKIIAVPFELSVKTSDSLISGDENEYAIEYKNISDYAFKKVNLRAEFFDGFNYISSQPEPGEKGEKYAFWSVENLNSSVEGQIILKGNISGNKDEKKSMKIILEASENGEDPVEYLSQEAVTEIQEAPIALFQTINGQNEYSVSKGEDLEYKIKFKNISDKELRGLVINSELEGVLADLTSLKVDNGSYDDKYKMTWSAFNVPYLASLGPGKEDEVSFKIKVKNYIEVKSSNDKNFTIKNTAKISSFNFDSGSVKLEKVIASSESNVKIGSSLFIKSRGYYNDDGRIANSGFIPPEVGKETTYTLHWYLSSLLGDLEDIRIVSVLPQNVSWTGNFIGPDGKISLGDENNGVFIPSINVSENGPAGNTEQDKTENAEKKQFEGNRIKEEKFYYDPQTRKVVWEIPALGANAGVVSPAKEIEFQIKITPTDADAGKIMKILDKVEAESYDRFTDKKIMVSESGLTTELPDDESIGPEEGIVIRSSEPADNNGTNP